MAEEKIETVIEINNLSKDYKTGFFKSKKSRAVDGLFMSVRGGQIFGFLGANGAGKTTTIKILMGLLFPTSGTATILGRPISDVRMHTRIGYCPENPYFYDYLSARELMNYFAEIFGFDRASRNRKSEELLQLVGLEESAWDRQLRKFSKGMLQRVGIAQALINDPEIVFLDEPMSGLDPIGRREIRELIAGLRTEGKTVFMSTHILSDIEALCDEVAIMRGGRLAAKGNLYDLLVGENQQQGFEVTVANVEASAMKNAFPTLPEVTEHPAGLIAKCHDENEVAAILEMVRNKGGKLISVEPVKQSLEDLFARDNS